MVVGESEILGQVRGAFTAATAAGTHTPVLSRLFHTAIRVGRRVRTQTAIGRRAVSVSSTAVALARTTLGDLADKTVLVVGAGEAGKLTAGNLAGSGVGRMLVTSRSAERTADLAAALGGEPVAFEQRASAIADADIVITSTAAHDFVIDRAMIEEAIGAASRARVAAAAAHRHRRAARHRPGRARGAGRAPVRHRRAAGGGGAEPAAASQRGRAAEAIVEEEVAKFGDWLRSLEVVPTVSCLRERADAVRLAEVERTLAKMELSAADRKRVEAMTPAIVKKLLHAPIARLKEPGEGERYVEAARALFGLDAPDENLEPRT